MAKRAHESTSEEKRLKLSEDLKDYFEINKQFERTSRKFHTTSSVYDVTISAFPEELDDPLTFGSRLFILLSRQ